MSTLQQRMAEAMQRRPDLTQADIARACGVSTPSVNGWVSGATKSLKPGTARLAAELFGCDQNWLATRSAAGPAHTAGMDSIYSRALLDGRPMKGPLNQALPTGQAGTTLDVLMAARNKAAADLQELAKNRAQYERQLGSQGWQQKVRQTEAQAQAAYQAFVAEAKRQGMGMFTE